MTDYREMYLTLFRKTEEAIQILIEVQQKCEEMYIDSMKDNNVVELKLITKKPKSTDEE